MCMIQNRNLCITTQLDIPTNMHVVCSHRRGGKVLTPPALVGQCTGMGQGSEIVYSFAMHPECICRAQHLGTRITVEESSILIRIFIFRVRVVSISLILKTGLETFELCVIEKVQSNVLVLEQNLRWSCGTKSCHSIVVLELL